MDAEPEALAAGGYSQRGLWGRHVGTLLGLLEGRPGERHDEAFLVELLGTLGNLTALDLPRTAKDPNPRWAPYAQHYGLVGWGKGLDLVRARLFVAPCSPTPFFSSLFF